MAERLDNYFCDDCGVFVTDGRKQCPECGQLLGAEKNRRARPHIRAADPDVIVEPDRSFESRLDDGFTMLDWG